MQLPLGKLPARKDSVTFKLAKYSSLPAAPSKGGHLALVDSDHNMFANDQIGDCVCAEAGHGTLYFNRQADKTVFINDAAVIAMYSAVTGYTPDDPATDQGTDMQKAASYRRKTGILDGQGKRHKILAYVALAKGNKAQAKQAIYYFGGFGLGFNFPDYAMDQFSAGDTWHLDGDSLLQGGHDVWVFAYDSRYLYCISWGKVVKMSWGFYAKYMDEGLVYLTNENLKSGKTLEGFDLVTLKADLAQL